MRYEIGKPIIENIKGIYKQTGVETKIISSRLLSLHINNGWTVKRKIYPLITSFKDWWKTLTNGNKIAFFALIIPLFFGGLKWTVDTYLNHKYPVLKKDYNSLNDKYHLLKESCNDSINELNKKIESISLELLSNKDSYKTKIDSL